MKTPIQPLTRRQLDNIEVFLRHFADIEAALKHKLGLHADDRTPVSTMAKRYGERNPYWRKSEENLLRLAEIRNVLTHQRSLNEGYPVALADNSVTKLRELHRELMQPVLCSKGFHRGVQTVSSKDSLSSVVVKIYELEFSQFPVIDDERFVGLITENEITHWLGHRAKANLETINLSEVRVSTVLREKGPYRKAAHPFRFERLGAPLVEVMSLFALSPTLEVVLLTESGNKGEQIEGIITEWDAARFIDPK